MAEQEQSEAVVAFIYDTTPYTELSEIGQLQWGKRAEYVLSPESDEQFGVWTKTALSALLGIARATLDRRLAWSRDHKSVRAHNEGDRPQTALGIASKVLRLSLKLAQRLASGQEDDEGAIQNTLVTIQAGIEMLQGIEAAIESRDLDEELAKVIELGERRSA